MKLSEIKKINHQAFGEYVLSQMREKGIKYNELSSELGFSPATLSLIIKGKRRASPDKILDLISYFNIQDEDIPLVTEKVTTPRGKNIFISYSHNDSEYLDRLMVHLKPLQRQGIIDPWVDTRLLAGDRWKTEIEKSLNSAKAAILLISADFLASDFIIENELPPLLSNAEKKGTLIIPVILKPCRFLREATLNIFQAINSPDTPLSSMDENEKELIYDTVSQRIEYQFGANG